MPKKEIPSLSGSGLQAWADAVEDGIESLSDEVLYRNNPAGQPNSMVNTDLDMNSNDILNANQVDASVITIGGVAITLADVSALDQIAVISTVATMKTTDYQAGQLVLTKGYHTENDGGGALYAIVTSATFGGTPDGYGDHTLTNGNVAQLKRDDDNRFNVMQYGARNDLAAFAVSEIQAAIDAAGSQPRGGTVFLPAGQYLVNATLTVTDNRVSIVGEDRYTTGLIRNQDYGDTILVNNNIAGTTLEHFRVEGLTIFHDTGVTTPTSGAMVRLIDVTHGEVHNLDLTGWYSGVLLEGCVDININRNSIIGQAALGANAGIQLVEHSPALVPLPTQINIVDTQVFGPRITGPTHGLLINAGEQVGIRGSYFGNATSYNVAILQTADNSTILEVSFDATTYIDGAGAYSVFISGAAGDGSTYLGQLTFNGTQIKGQGGDSLTGIRVDGTPRGGTYDQFCRGLVVKGCTISGMNGSGIQIDGAVQTVISSNDIKGNNFFNTAGGRGIQLGANTDKTIIEGNFIGSNPEGIGNSLHLFGIEVIAGATNYKINDNNVEYNPTGLLDNGGVATTSNAKEVQNNTGYNPTGAQAVAVPASGVTLYNPLGQDALVSVFGGTVSNITLDGATFASATNVSFPIAAGSSVTLTYTVAPSWVWWGQ